MIGFYNYTVILTYMGLASSLIGIYLAMSGSHITMAVIALMISGLCDMFDGKVARTRKRTDDEKKFGIQIDSLCDLICFGLLRLFCRYEQILSYRYNDFLYSCRADTTCVFQCRGGIKTGKNKRGKT